MLTPEQIGEIEARADAGSRLMPEILAHIREQDERIAAVWSISKWHGGSDHLICYWGDVERALDGSP